ncbi:MAG: polyprenyl synthetase family protein [Brevinema sp.]
MSFFEYTNRVKPDIIASIKDQCDHISKIPLPNASLFSDYLCEFTTRGKLLRGIFVRLVAESFDTNISQTNTVSGALELAESALLMHDDIMDNDDLRRGKLSMHRLLEQNFHLSNHGGKSLALCLGDLTLFSLFSHLSFSRDLVDLFSYELSMTALGQALEIEKSGQHKDLSKKEILSIIEHKTAHYTFVLPFLAGAILSHQDDHIKKTLQKLGVIMGYLFQIRDDELNFFSQEMTGKPSGGDIRENKKTLCRYELLQEFPSLEVYFGQENNVSIVQEHYQRSKSKNTIASVLSSYREQAFSLLKQLPIMPKYKTIWEDLICYLSERSY